MSPAQTSTDVPTTDKLIYQKFWEWVRRQPTDAQQGDPFDAYRAILAVGGLGAPEIERQINLITEQGQRLEIERWNDIFTAPTPIFNTEPNVFLIEMIRGVSPGRALDVGMGQGRNALYLAQQGWAVTGFDPADKAVASAEEEAQRLGVKLKTEVLREDEFDYGIEQWDLVVFIYVGLRELLEQVYDALKPGGLVVVEGFHRDATRNASIHGGVVFDTNELLKLFERFRILRYEDADGVADYGNKKARLVRLCAQKP